jgi:hypothetical protein
LIQKKMETEMKRTRQMVALVALFAMLLFMGYGCASPSSDGQVGEKSAAGFFPHVVKTGGQIWAENCTRCHNPRPSTQYSAQQWDLITTHMRLRCNLNGEEQRAVYHFMTGT